MDKKKRAETCRVEYGKWKLEFLEREGFFPVFQPFLDEHILSRLSGNAVRLYLYLGLRTKNTTGECWVTVETMATYFKKSRRTIANWIAELEREHLIERIQFEQEEPAHTFLRPYGR